jgi:hypothetical protein
VMRSTHSIPAALFCYKPAATTCYGLHAPCMSCRGARRRNVLLVLQEIT